MKSLNKIEAKGFVVTNKTDNDILLAGGGTLDKNSIVSSKRTSIEGFNGMINKITLLSTRTRNGMDWKDYPEYDSDIIEFAEYWLSITKSIRQLALFVPNFIIYRDKNDSSIFLAYIDGKDLQYINKPYNHDLAIDELHQYLYKIRIGEDVSLLYFGQAIDFLIKNYAGMSTAMTDNELLALEDQLSARYSYLLLGDAPDIPTKTSQLQNDSGYITSQDISGKADRSEVPTKVSELDNDSNFITEADISGKADKSDIPTKTSQLTNDSNFLTEHQDISNKADKSEIPTKVSELENDKGYLTEHQDISGKADKSEVPTKLSQLTNDKGFVDSIEVLPAKNGESGLSPYLVGYSLVGGKLTLQTGRKVCLGELTPSTTDNNTLYTVKTDANQSGWNEKQEQKNYVANSSGSALGNLVIDLPNKSCFNLRLVKSGANTTVDIDFHTTEANLSLRNRMQLNVPYEFIFHALSYDFTLNIKAYWTKTLETKAIPLKKGRSLYIKVIRTNAISSPSDMCRFLECVVTGEVLGTNSSDIKQQVMTMDEYNALTTKDPDTFYYITD